MLYSDTRLQKALLTLLSAFLIILAAPPFDLWPLAFVCLVPFYSGIRHSSPWLSAGLAWMMGFAAILGGSIWWVPLLENFASLSLISSLGLTIAICAYQSLVFAVWAGICSLLFCKWGLSWLLTGPLCIVLAEAALPFIFKLYLSVTIWRAWPLIQAAELGGPPAVSALIVLGNLVAAETVLAISKHCWPGSAVKLGALVFIFVLALGWIRAEHIATIRRKASVLKVGLVQPNFGIVSIKERKNNGDKYIRALRQATSGLAGQKSELIIWPESSWPYLFDRQMKHEYPPGHPWELRPGKKTKLVFGTLSHTFGGTDIYNSAVFLSETGLIAGKHDKVCLVPFAEYIPFSETFPEAAKRCRANLPLWPDIVPGEFPKVLSDGKLRIGSLICSEDIDMNFVHKIALQKPNLLVSLINDAWFGGSAAPRQHLALAVFRAVETRRELVRSTNTGVSAIIDALGRVQSEGPLIDASRNKPRQVTTLAGNVALLETFALGPYTIRFFPYGCLLILAAAIIGTRKRRKK
ncbi:MAG: apolipoprotein N-acyltransferase [Desulfobacteraceae bacterium]|nr:apolipoprotein N-acyltransferase [Desulfobacteraceae bacterium]